MRLESVVNGAKYVDYYLDSFQMISLGEQAPDSR